MLTYDPATGNGIVAVSGQRYTFDIHRWKSDSAPKVGSVVEVHTLADGTQEFRPCSDVKSAVEGSAAKLSQGTVGQLIRSGIKDLGWPLIVAHAIFAVSIFTVPVMRSEIADADVRETIWAVFGDWPVQLLLVLAILSPLTVLIRTHSRYWLSMGIPAAVCVYFSVMLYQFSSSIEEIAAISDNNEANIWEKFAAMAWKSLYVDWNGFAVFFVAGVCVSVIAYYRFKKKVARNSVAPDEMLATQDRAPAATAKSGQQLVPEAAQAVGNKDSAIQELATRRRRLGAVLIDGAIAMTWGVPVAMALGTWQYVGTKTPPPLVPTITGAVIGMIFFALTHGYFLQRDGQTIGKKLLGIRIVDLAGNVPSLSRVLGLRYLPIFLMPLLAMVPGLQMGIQVSSVVDLLFIFRRDHRCIHDLIAGTKVIRGSA